MFFSRLSFILLLALVSARPSPELSLEDIEKELEQLTAKKSDISVTEKKSIDKSATDSDLSKELTDLAREVPKASTLDASVKSVTKNEQKKDATSETKSVLDEKSAGFDLKADSLAEKSAKPDFKDTEAYRRLMDYYHDRSASPSSPWDKMKDYGSEVAVRQHRTFNRPPLRKPYYPEAPIRRNFADYSENRQRFSDPTDFLRRLSSAHQSDLNRIRGEFLPEANNNEISRGANSDITKIDHRGFSSRSWVPGSEPVRVPDRMALPINRDTKVRSYNDAEMRLNDLTDDEKRKRYLMDLLAKELKSKVDDAQKRGLEVPDKIMDFLWNYESRRGMNAKPDKSLLSH